MKNFLLVTGGARSGKSSFAEEKASELGEKITYIATSINSDEGMQHRIEKHRSDRPSEWATIEMYKDFKNLDNEGDFIESDLILLDCITLMVSNLLLESEIDFDKCTYEDIDKIESNIFDEIDILISQMDDYDKVFIVVTNEVGMGIVPSYKSGIIFRDIAGRVNQYLASRAREVYMLVSGIPMKIK